MMTAVECRSRARYFIRTRLRNDTEILPNSRLSPAFLLVIFIFLLDFTGKIVYSERRLI